MNPNRSRLYSPMSETPAPEFSVDHDESSDDESRSSGYLLALLAQAGDDTSSSASAHGDSRVGGGDGADGVYLEDMLAALDSSVNSVSSRGSDDVRRRLESSDSGRGRSRGEATEAATEALLPMNALSDYSELSDASDRASERGEGDGREDRADSPPPPQSSATTAVAAATPATTTTQLRDAATEPAASRQPTAGALALERAAKEQEARANGHKYFMETRYVEITAAQKAKREADRQAAAEAAAAKAKNEARSRQSVAEWRQRKARQNAARRVAAAEAEAKKKEEEDQRNEAVARNRKEAFNGFVARQRAISEQKAAKAKLREQQKAEEEEEKEKKKAESQAAFDKFVSSERVKTAVSPVKLYHTNPTAKPVPSYWATTERSGPAVNCCEDRSNCSGGASGARVGFVLPTTPPADQPLIYGREPRVRPADPSTLPNPPSPPALFAERERQQRATLTARNILKAVANGGVQQ